MVASAASGVIGTAHGIGCSVLSAAKLCISARICWPSDCSTSCTQRRTSGLNLSSKLY